MRKLAMKRASRMPHHGALALSVLTALTLTACGGPELEQDEKVVTLEENSSENNTTAANNTTANNTTANNTTANNTTANNTTAPNMSKFDDCPVEARPVYVIDGRDYMLSSFHPDTLEFRDVGVIDCPTQVAEATPFSMSVDRDATAWVLFTSGELFLVDTLSGSCLATQFRPNNGFELFGMGYVLEEPGSDTDILYIAGGTRDDLVNATAALGRVDFDGLTYQPIEELGGNPELTGTARGELWGFFPGTAPPRVSRIDRDGGGEQESFPITGIDGDPNAWAFAFWGGDFWLFYKSQTDPSTRIFKLESDDGSVTEIDSDTGRYIVGAGVSTCAPVATM